MSEKYPRTPHLPWSPGATSDDRRLSDVSSFLNRPLVLTEKMDGSNVCLEAKSVFARSHSSAPKHESFDALKALHHNLAYRLPDYQFFGEWLYAKHSIHYTNLPAYLLLFGIREPCSGEWLSWEEVEEWASDLSVPTVPVLMRGATFTRESELRSCVDSLMASPSALGGEREGVVIRTESGFPGEGFGQSVAKCVRANHVQTSEHWKNQTLVRNLLGWAKTI